MMSARQGILAQGLPDIAWIKAGHAVGIGGAAFLPDGQTIASGSLDGTIKLWRISDGAFLRTISAFPPLSAFALAVSPDGQWIATGSVDKNVYLWRVSDGTLMKTFSGHTDLVFSVAFSPDGQTLASGSRDKTAKLWRISDGTVLGTYTGHTDFVNSVAFSPDGQQVASGSNDKTVQVWRVSDQMPVRSLTDNTTAVRGVAFSPDGTALASGSNDGVRVWKVADWSAAWSNASGRNVVAFSPDSQTLVSGSAGNTALLWKAADGTPGAALSGHANPIKALAFSADGKTLATVSKETFNLWDTATYSLLSTPTLYSASLASVVYTPDGQRLVTGGSDAVKVWNAGDGTALHSFPYAANRLVVTPDGQAFIRTGVSTGNSGVQGRSLVDGSLLANFSPFGGLALALSPDGSLLASGELSPYVDYIRTTDDTAMGTVTGNTNYSVKAAFSPDGKTLATCGQDGVRTWTVPAVPNENVALIRSFSTESTVADIAFSPDGQTLASAGIDGATLWKVADGTKLITLAAQGVYPYIETLAFSSDGRFLAGAGITLNLWRLSDRKLLVYYDKETALAQALTFSPDGKRIAYGRNDATLVVVNNPFSRLGSVVNVASTAGNPGRVVLLRGLLRSTPGAAYVSGKTLSFQVDGQAVGTAVTDAQGLAKFSWTIPNSATPGVKPLVVSFAGDSDYTAGQAAGTVTITYQSVLTTAFAAGNAGQSVLLRALLRQNPGAVAVPGKTITFEAAGVTVGTAVTDGTGNARFKWTIPVDTPTGAETFQAIFAGDATVAASAGTNTLTVNPASVLVTVANTAGKSGQTVLLRALLRRVPDGLRLDGKTLTFKVNGTVVGTAVTQSNGVAGLNYTIAAGQGTGNVTISAAFAGDSRLQPGSGTGTLTVNP